MQIIDGEKKIKCKHCEGGIMRRRRRKGFLDRVIFTALGFYPWRCDRCKQMARLHDRGYWRLPSGSAVENQTVHQTLQHAGTARSRHSVRSEF